jgi:shikimate kinase
MIISLNGWPGVGKLTVGLELADILEGRLLDSHTLFNVAITLTDYRSTEYYDVARGVRDIAFEYVLRLPPDIPVILTNVIAIGGPSGFAEEHWQAVCHLARDRKCHLYSATLDCEPDEQVRRMALPSRRAHKKLLKPEIMPELRRTRSLFDDGADYRNTFDNSGSDPHATAVEIASWVRATLPR